MWNSPRYLNVYLLAILWIIKMHKVYFWSPCVCKNVIRVYIDMYLLIIWMLILDGEYSAKHHVTWNWLINDKILMIKFVWNEIKLYSRSVKSENGGNKLYFWQLSLRRREKLNIYIYFLVSKCSFIVILSSPDV